MRKLVIAKIQLVYNRNRDARDELVRMLQNQQATIADLEKLSDEMLLVMLESAYLEMFK
jgi:hypothetical protein